MGKPSVGPLNSQLWNLKLMLSCKLPCLKTEPFIHDGEIDVSLFISEHMMLSIPEDESFNFVYGSFLHCFKCIKR